MQIWQQVLPTTATVNVLDEEGADGRPFISSLTMVGPVLTLDQNDTGEQKFVVAERSVYHSARRYSFRTKL
ncbi:hypothetical protein O9929_20640 [Vibrio lentus]|nr:hypothetical protein [Vibrio lentus]